jgi:hypothetical protein
MGPSDSELKSRNSAHKIKNENRRRNQNNAVGETEEQTKHETDSTRTGCFDCVLLFEVTSLRICERLMALHDHGGAFHFPADGIKTTAGAVGSFTHLDAAMFADERFSSSHRKIQLNHEIIIHES